MKDSRLGEVEALIDDARTILADMAEEIDSDPLEAARHSLNVTLGHLSILERTHHGE